MSPLVDLNKLEQYVNGAEEETRSINNIIDLIMYFCHLLALGT